MSVIDLRSDTVTQPTPAMRKAMAEAEVGDDVFEEDATVKRLEAMAAERMGKEAALFVASGTMANLVSLLVHCNRGDEVILGDRAHTFLYEQGGIAALGGIHPHTVPNRPDGTLALEDLEEAVRAENVHFPRTRLVVLENTHNRCYGSPLPLPYLNEVRALADRNRLSVHVDGARIFNAAVALGEGPADLAAPADSVTFCLSKGLCAPVGSLVCGNRDFIYEARRARKVLGGGMRQAGVLAAAGIVALEEMVDRLTEDHENAHRLAEGLSGHNHVFVDSDRVKTNIVYLDLEETAPTASEAAEALARCGLLLLATGPRRLRAVTHYPITAQEVDRALQIIHRVL